MEAKNLNSPVLKSFQQIQKLLALYDYGNKLLIQYKIKSKVWKIMTAGLSPNQDLSNHAAKTEF